MTLTLTWPRVVGMVLRKILDQYVSSYQSWIKSVIRLGNNEVLKTLTKTLTFVDANADTGGSTIALPERCSGELKILWLCLWWGLTAKSTLWHHVELSKSCEYGSESPRHMMWVLRSVFLEKLEQEFRGRRHRTCWRKSHRSHNQNVVIK